MSMRTTRRLGPHPSALRLSDSGSVPALIGERYAPLRILGQGSFGRVVLARDTRAAGEVLVAVKELQPRGLCSFWVTLAVAPHVAAVTGFAIVGLLTALGWMAVTGLWTLGRYGAAVFARVRALRQGTAVQDPRRALVWGVLPQYSVLVGTLLVAMTRVVPLGGMALAVCVLCLLVLFLGVPVIFLVRDPSRGLLTRQESAQRLPSAVGDVQRPPVQH